MEVATLDVNVHDRNSVSYYSAQFIKEGSAGQLLQCSLCNAANNTLV